MQQQSHECQEPFQSECLVCIKKNTRNSGVQPPAIDHSPALRLEPARRRALRPLKRRVNRRCRRRGVGLLLQSDAAVFADLVESAVEAALPRSVILALEDLARRRAIRLTRDVGSTRDAV